MRRVGGLSWMLRVLPLLVRVHSVAPIWLRPGGICRHQLSGPLFGGTALFSSAILSRRKMMASTRAYTANTATAIIKMAYRMPMTPKAGLKLITTPT
jgi:hypothetical protein